MVISVVSTWVNSTLLLLAFVKKRPAVKLNTYENLETKLTVEMVDQSKPTEEGFTLGPTESVSVESWNTRGSWKCFGTIWQNFP